MINRLSIDPPRYEINKMLDNFRFIMDRWFGKRDAVCSIHIAQRFDLRGAPHLIHFQMNDIQWSTRYSTRKFYNLLEDPPYLCRMMISALARRGVKPTKPRPQLRYSTDPIKPFNRREIRERLERNHERHAATIPMVKE